MIDVNEAVKNALSFLSVLPTAEKLQNPRVEAVEITPDDDFWLVTISFTVAPEGPGAAIGALTSGPQRLYKLFRINAESGQVRAMTMRESKQ